ncbi:DUF2971 domain-containing protein [Mycobacterium conspicuum]|uniref:Uncharacterized protein n=1 Tax=Mycobacterium conspicuum TaxID=44010 RepID=A0A1X1T6T2_9MYCO|nr:DUF2971 domain-containing protein [Mycobacterium conspicuum]ORV40215.1 hypothetical protein AWC00_16235 [Mycobacterium conspicuum]BBZ37094.1 hypothetical protein MCNS_01570 [Mycobacterium conspicuum]
MFNRLPETLYHYTGISGLRGILDSSMLYATNIAYLNDAQEMKHGIKEVSFLLSPASPVVKDLISENPPFEKAINEVLSRLRAEFVSEHHQSLLQAPYVSCLSAMGDQLSQWQGYAGQGGYAIHFDARTLRNSVRLHGLESDEIKLDRTRYALSQIAYTSEDAGSYVAELLDRLVIAIRDQFEGDPERGDYDLGLSYEFALIELEEAVAKMKNSAFEGEHEYRIVAYVPEKAWDNRNSFHEPSSIGLIPRIKLDFEPSCITGVTVGPGENMGIRQNSLEHYFDMHWDKFGYTEVIPSDVSLRPL